MRAVYLEAAAYAGGCVGELLTDLKERGLYDDTTIILTSDHGDELMEHGRIGHGKNLFDTSLRVPLIIKSSGLEPGRMDRRVSNATILPTVMRWFGEELHSTNLGPLGPYTEDPSPGNAEIFAGFFGRDKVIMSDGRAAMRHEGEYLFFDIDADPGETDPLEKGQEALAAVEKARFTSARLAGEAGVRGTYSTYAGQNPYVDIQNRLAQAEIERGAVTALEAARLKSLGHFLGEKARAGPVGQTRIDPRTLSPARREQLRALGHLN